MEYVFVYGTLMKGYWNHHFLVNSRYIGDGELKGYEMYQVSSFPGIVPKENEFIKGEVYKINDITLRTLDQLEHEGTMYKRKIVSVAVGNEIVDCYVYVWNYAINPWCKKVMKTPWKPRRRN